MSLSSSAQFTFSHNIRFPDCSFSRHCIVSQALNPLLPPPISSSGPQAAFSSSHSGVEEGSTGSWSSDLALSQVSSTRRVGISVSSFVVKKDARPVYANEDIAEISPEAVKEKATSRAESGSKSNDRSEKKKVVIESISEISEESTSYDYGPSNPNDELAGEFKRLPINLELSLYRAKCLFRQRQYEEAEKILRQCIKDWPTDGKAYVTLGTRLLKLGRFVEARAVYEDGCQATRGENPYIWQAWAVLEQKLGHISQARKLFDASTAADIKHAAAWHGWAVLELQQGSTRKAQELLSKGLKFCGSNEFLYQTSALIKYRTGNIEEARVLFSQAVTCNPKSCASWLAWALMEADKCNISTARYLFQRGIRASPKNRYAWQAWALFESNQGKKQWARRLFEQGMELNPHDAVLIQAFSLFEYSSGNPERAIELLKIAASEDPKHQPVWNAWGWIEWKLGNFESARQFYRKSLAVNSRSAEAARTYHAWAIMEEEAKNYAASRELFKYALRVDPQNIPAWRSWANLEEKLGNIIRAEEIRMQYLQQRTEVVDTAPYISLSNMLAPAINRIKDFFKIQTPLASTDDDDGGGDLMPEIMEVLKRRKFDMDEVKCDDDFDLEAFIREVLPWKYTSQSNTEKSKLKRTIVSTVSS